LLNVVILVVCVVGIYLSCEWFVNAVEWLGRRLQIGKMAVGTILAAIGTALPESVVTLVAVTTGRTAEAKDIGVGAALGGPLVLSTLAYGITGIAILVVRHRRAVSPETAGDPAGGTGGTRESGGTGVPGGTTEPRATGRRPVGTPAQLRHLAKDQAWFLPIFAVKVGLGLVAFAVKPWLGLLFFAAYAAYFWREIRTKDDEEGEELEPLKLQPKAENPSIWLVVLQTLATLALIFLASHFFVQQLEAIGPMIGLSASVTALLLSPVATELPETMNALIWVRQGKTELALANISGSMMIQATVPSGLGILFTTWHLDAPLLWSGGITAAAIVYLLVTMARHKLTAGHLAVTAGLYAVFAAGLIWWLA